MLAAESSAVSVVELLVQRGADLSAVDTNGYDVVHYTKLSEMPDVKAALIAALSKHNLSGDRTILHHTHKCITYV